MSVNEKMTAIADAIRDKTGGKVPLSLDDMATSIDEVYEAGKATFDEQFAKMYEGCTDFAYKFSSCPNLIIAPQIDTSNATGAYQMYGACSNLKKVLGDVLDFSKVTNGMSSLFNMCSQLEEVPIIILPEKDGVSSLQIFWHCYALKRVTLRNTVHKHTWNTEFRNCNALEAITEPINMSNVTYLTGQEFLNCNSLTYIRFEGEIPLSINFGQSPLTIESCRSIITALKDYSGTDTTQTLTLSTVSKSYLSESDIATITQKGWTLA